MFGLSFAHMILLAALALIVIGPKQLPDVARTIGRFLNELKRLTSDVTKTIMEARDSVDLELKNPPPGAAHHHETPPSSGHGPGAGPEAATSEAAATSIDPIKAQND